MLLQPSEMKYKNLICNCWDLVFCQLVFVPTTTMVIALMMVRGNENNIGANTVDNHNVDDDDHDHDIEE